MAGMPVAESSAVGWSGTGLVVASRRHEIDDVATCHLLEDSDKKLNYSMVNSDKGPSDGALSSPDPATQPSPWPPPGGPWNRLLVV